VGFQIDLFRVTKADPLVLGEIPKLLEPHVLGILEKLCALYLQPSGFFLAYFIQSLHQMADNMELVKDKQGLERVSPDRLYVGSPYVTADCNENLLHTPRCFFVFLKSCRWPDFDDHQVAPFR
jgi:hypothetical protein